MSEPLPQIVKDYRIAVAEHVLCPGPAACTRDHAAVERNAAEKLRAALADPATLRHHAEQLAAALEETVQQQGEDDGKPCWCELPYMVPYRGHDTGCEAARAALSAWREGPGAARKGQGEG